MIPADSSGPGDRPAGPCLPERGTNIVSGLWRARWLMLLVFVPVLAVSLVAILSSVSPAGAAIRFLVTPSPDRPAAQANGLALAEAELIRSPQVLSAALQVIGAEALFPGLAGDCPGPACEPLAMATVLSTLSIEPQPGGRVISLEFRHPDSGLAVRFLNALADAYLAYRPSVTAEENVLSYRAQAGRFEDELARVDTAISAYLRQHGLAGLEMELDTLANLHSAASAALMQAQARASHIDAELDIWRARAARLPSRDEQPVPDAASLRLDTLRAERAEQRARLAPDDPQLLDLDERIARLEALSGEAGRPARVLRSRINPFWQEAQSVISRLEAEAAGVAGQTVTLHTQLASIEERRLALLVLIPQLEALQRRRQALAEGAQRYAGLAEAAWAATELARDGAGEVRLLGPATAPLRAPAGRMSDIFLAVMAALMVALSAGLADLLLRRERLHRAPGHERPVLL